MNKPVAATAIRRDPAEGASPGFIQVAFAGHSRADDLGDERAAAAGLEEAFRILALAGVERARLLTGLAPGADVLAVQAWRAVGLGPAHAVFPFLADKAPPDALALVENTTWLDGMESRRAGRNPYLDQTRWLIGAADLLVVVWGGQTARGAGGTADAVRLALEHRTPVLWVRPGQRRRVKLIGPEYLPEDFGFLEFLENLNRTKAPLVQPADPSVVRDILLEMGATAVESTELVPEPPPRRRPRTYRIFRRVLGGRAAPHPATAPPPDLQAEPGFQRLSNALARADAAANDLGALHRSHQVILLALAILTALAGASSALWPGLEAAWVAAELWLALMAVAIWRDSERAHRHQRWGEARRLAEDLRLERAAWTLGISTTSFSSNLASVPRAHRERRLAGLPTGAFHSARVQSWGLWTLDDLIHGQAHYHRSQGLLNGRIAHRIHMLENAAGFALLAVLGAYLATWAAMLGLHGEPPPWLTNLVFVAGTVVPAIAAASIALEATLALGEESQRSLTLSAQLDDLVTERPEDGLQGYQRLAKEAIRLQRAQEDRWAEGWVRRRLVRPG